MLTHIDSNNNPTMVDVTGKQITARSAWASTEIQLPDELKLYFKNNEIYLKKGPVFQTAIIAGTMAAKRTHELIPFCHQVPVESCQIDISMNSESLVTVHCRVKTTFRTGVEMEALHGAMTAALTIYDMCKAISHNIVIQETKLIGKVGGKRTILQKPLYGLVLTGGKSKRMSEDKALISYKKKPHAEHIYEILQKFCEQVFLSAQENQWIGTPLEKLPSLVDKTNNLGPIGGMLTAFQKFPDVNWFVVACDLVHFNDKTVETLLSNFDEGAVATCFRNAEERFPEALCAIYTPQAKYEFEVALQNDIRCPVKVLRNADIKLIDQSEDINLANINTPEERKKALENEINSN